MSTKGTILRTLRVSHSRTKQGLRKQEGHTAASYLVLDKIVIWVQEEPARTATTSVLSQSSRDCKCEAPAVPVSMPSSTTQLPSIRMASHGICTLLPVRINKSPGTRRRDSRSWAPAEKSVSRQSRYFPTKTSPAAPCERFLEKQVKCVKREASPQKWFYL